MSSVGISNCRSAPARWPGELHSPPACGHNASCMSDQKLRELERRWRETKSVDDEAAYCASACAWGTSRRSGWSWRRRRSALLDP